MKHLGLFFQIPKYFLALTITELWVWKLLDILKSLSGIAGIKPLVTFLVGFSWHLFVTVGHSLIGMHW